MSPRRSSSSPQPPRSSGAGHDCKDPSQTLSKISCTASFNLRLSGALAKIKPEAAFALMAIGLAGSDGPSAVQLLKSRETYYVQPAADGKGMVYTLSSQAAAALRVWVAAAGLAASQIQPAKEAVSQPASTSSSDNAPQGSTAAPMEGSEIKTRFGSLNVDDSQALTLNGRKVQPTIKGNNSLQLGDVYALGNVDLVLATDQGGSGCPEQIAVIIVSAQGVRSPGEFGTCAETGDIKRVGNTLVTTMPGFEGEAETEAERDRAATERHEFIFYPDGRVTNNGRDQSPVPFGAG